MEAEMARQRIRRVREWMAQQGLDAFYLRDVANIAWATAFDGVFDAEAAHALLITRETAVLHTDSRYATACRAAAVGGPVAVDDAPGGDGRAKEHAAWAAERLESLQGDEAPVLGIEDSMALGEFRKLERELSADPAACAMRETSKAVLGMRAVKDECELDRLRAAQAIADAAFAHMVEWMRPGMTERQVQAELDSCMRRLGADEVAFPTIVATGANGANPHAQPGEAVLEPGHCVVMDFGARRAGYHSDMTRTVFVGEPPEELRRAYTVLRQANEQVQAALRPGITGRQAHELAERILAEGGFAGRMGHSLGHGVGLNVHEEPVLALRNEQALEAGNVVTVEPGIYLQGAFGMRLEDCGVVTDEGFDVFGQSTHDLVII